jgi:prolyl 4-hydroxylase
MPLQLNDVERGGSTAFPRAGVAVKPVKGGAAFWYNLKRSGKPDPLTLHGACPVLLGHKWGELPTELPFIFSRLVNL